MDNTKCIICGKEIPERRLRKGKTTCGRSCAQVLRFQDPEQKASFKQVMSNVMNNQETRAKISTSLKQPHHLERQRKVQRDLSNNKEAQEKKRKSLKKTWETKDREEHSAAIKQGQKEHNAIEKISASSLEHWQNEEYRSKVTAGDKAWWTDERKQNHSVTLTEVYANPEVRLAVSSAVTEAFKRPEVKANHKAGIAKALENEQMHINLSIGISNAYKQRKEQILQKRNETKRQNNSFHISKPELLVKQFLEQVFSDVQYQHISKEYPFNCDFYVPSLDLYIECHFNWTHGGRPFNENDESCIEQLNAWKEKAKTSKFYQNAIYVWTDLDVRKRQCVIDSNLNWLAFYSMGDFEEWLNNLL